MSVDDARWLEIRIQENIFMLRQNLECERLEMSGPTDSHGVTWRHLE